jgi:hypothetical protein
MNVRRLVGSITVETPSGCPAQHHGATMTDRVFATSGDWGLASDGLQWMLCRRYNDRGKVCWRPVSFVRSTKDILARCMRDARQTEGGHLTFPSCKMGKQ